jgi:hypothetical protein
MDRAMSTDELDQHVLDTTAHVESSKGIHPQVRDVVTRIRQTTSFSRTDVEHAIHRLSPWLLTKGGMPGNPTVSLTLDGWLNSSARPRIIAIIDCILEAYRNKASNTEQDLDQGLDGADLQSAGLTDHDAGLLSACGPRLQIFLNASGLGTKAPVSGIRMHSPWDIDAILELKDAEEFHQISISVPA